MEFLNVMKLFQYNDLSFLSLEISIVEITLRLSYLHSGNFYVEKMWS